jgi:hypothetical protein
VGAVRLVPVVAAVVAGAVVADVLLLTSGSPAPSIAPTAPVTVRAAFDHNVVQFGDPVTAHVVVVLDRDAVRARTLRVTDDVAPLTALSAPHTSRTVSGRLETVSITQRVACLTDPCVTGAVRLPRVRASVSARGGGAATASAPWRTLRLRSRVSAADLAASSPPFASDPAPPTPSYRVAPSTAETVLEIVVALAAAGAAALIAFEALAFARRRRPAVAGDEVARALRLAREAEQRPAPDRRRALALLARLLPSTEARDLAWSAPAPEPDDLTRLVEDVERERVG